MFVRNRPSAIASTNHDQTSNVSIVTYEGNNELRFLVTRRLQRSNPAKRNKTERGAA